MATAPLSERVQKDFAITAGISKLCRTHGAHDVARVMRLWLTMWDDESEDGQER